MEKQEEPLRVIREREMSGILHHLFREGKPFFGISAGSIMLALRWIRWADPADDASAEPFDCLGFASVFCDTHGEDDGWEELRTLLRLCPVGTIGHGIVSGTDLVAQPDGSLSAIGGEVHRYQNREGRIIRIESLFPKNG